MATEEDFASQFEQGLKRESEEAALAMLARGRVISYRERDTPPGHVIREYPDGTKTVVKVEMPATPSAA